MCINTQKKIDGKLFKLLSPKKGETKLAAIVRRKKALKTYRFSRILQSSGKRTVFRLYVRGKKKK